MKNLHEIYISLGKLLAEAVFSPEQLAGAVKAAKETKKAKEEAEKAPKKAEPIKRFHAAGEAFGGLLPTEAPEPSGVTASEPGGGRRATGTHPLTAPYTEQPKPEEFPTLAFPVEGSKHMYAVMDVGAVDPAHIISIGRQKTHAHLYSPRQTLGSGKTIKRKGQIQAVHPTRSLAGTDPFDPAEDPENTASVHIYDIAPEHKSKYTKFVPVSEVKPEWVKAYKHFQKTASETIPVWSSLLARKMVSPESAADAATAEARVHAFEIKGAAPGPNKPQFMFSKHAPVTKAPSVNPRGHRISPSQVTADTTELNKPISVASRTGAETGASLAAHEAKAAQLQGAKSFVDSWVQGLIDAERGKKTT